MWPESRAVPTPTQLIGAAVLQCGCAAAPGKASNPAAAVDSGSNVDSAAEVSACAAALDALDGVEVVPDRVFPACAVPTGRVYVDAAEAWGLAGPSSPVQEHNQGGVSAVADFNQDGVLDVILGYAGQPLVFYVGNGSGFEGGPIDGTEGAGPLLTADFNGDGRLDLASVGPPAVWLRNTGSGFEVLLLETELQAPIAALSAADFDSDGHLDLFAAASGPHAGGPEDRADRWLRGDGTGGFEAQELPLPDGGGLGFDSLAFDLDADGDLDVYTVNDFGVESGPNALWDNQEGRFVSRGAELGANLAISGMGADAADLDGDRIPELLLASTGKNHLLHLSSDGAYTDVAAATGVDPLLGLPTMAWGQIFFDHNDNGLLDVVVAEGDLWLADTDPELRAEYSAPLHLMVQTGSRSTWAFEDHAEALGLTGTGSWRSVVPADFDADGQVDLLVLDVDGPPRLFLATGCTGNGAMEVDAPMHARVEACIGGERQVRWSRAESGWGGSRPLGVRFGLGPHAAPETVVVVPPR